MSVRILCTSLLLFLFCCVSTSAQTCFHKLLNEGIKAYNAQLYKESIHYLRQAQECNDRPRVHKLRTWIDRAQQAYITQLENEAKGNDPNVAAKTQILLAQKDSVNQVLKAENQQISQEKNIALAEKDALSSLQLPSQQKYRKTRLALQSMQGLKQNSGNLNDPTLLVALYDAAKSLHDNGTFDYLKPNSEAVRVLQMHPNDKLLMSGWSSGQLSAWQNDTTWGVFVDSLLENHPLASVTAKEPLIRWAASPSGDWMIASGGQDLHLWNKRSSVHQTVQLHGEKMSNQVQFWPDESSIISAGGDNFIRLYDLRTQETRPIMGYGARVNAFTMIPDNDEVIFAGSDGILMRTSLQRRELVDVLSENFPRGINHLQAIPDLPFQDTLATALVATREDGNILIYTIEEEKVRIFNRLPTHGSVVSDILLQDSILFITSLDGTLSIWDTQKMLEIDYEPLVFEGKEWMLTITYDPETQSIITGDLHGGIQYWNLDPNYYMQKIRSRLEELQNQTETESASLNKLLELCNASN
ncbi:MAG: WD40 repeat domain-containing protein [Bacteroidota bacterium]